LRHDALRNMESAAITSRRVKGIGRKGRIWGVILVIRCRGGGKVRRCFSLPSAAARRGLAMRRVSAVDFARTMMILPPPATLTTFATVCLWI
jgi:hypothetical protein